MSREGEEKLFHYFYAHSPPELAQPATECSFLSGVSESFFKLPTSMLNSSIILTEQEREIEGEKRDDSALLHDSTNASVILADSTTIASAHSADTSATLLADLGCTQPAPLLFLPETQYSTPAAPSANTSILITAEQSVCLPSLPSVLEATVRSAQRRRSLLGVPVQVKMADRLVSDFEDSTGSPFVGKGAEESSLLIEAEAEAFVNDSLSAAMERSMTIMSSPSKENTEAQLNAQGKTKFSLDFLNTPPLALLPSGTQGVLQAFAPSQSIDAELSGVVADDSMLQAGELVPGSETDLDGSGSSCQDLMLSAMEYVDDEEEEEEGHDSVIFPASFDDSNNPFLATQEKVVADERESEEKQMETIKEDESAAESITRSLALDEEMIDALTTMDEPSAPAYIATIDSNTLSSADTTTMSVTKEGLHIANTITNPMTNTIANPIATQITNTSNPMPNTPSRLPAKLTAQTPLRTPSGSAALSMAPLLKKSLGARLRRDPVAPNSNVKNKSIEERATRLFTEVPLPRTPCAEPRKTPLPGSSSLSSVRGSGLASRILTPRKVTESAMSTDSEDVMTIQTDGEATVRRDIKSTVQSPSQTTTLAIQSPKQSLIQSTCQSPSNTAAVPSETVCQFPCNTVPTETTVFFKDPNASSGSLLFCGSLGERASRTRDLWRIKSYTTGHLHSLASTEYAHVTKLRPGDAIYSARDGKVSGGPFRFKGFAADGRSVVHEEGSIKISRLAIEAKDLLVLSLRTVINPDCTTTSSPAAKKRSALLSATDSPAKRPKTTAQLFNGLKFLITCGSEDSATLKKYSQLIEEQGGELLSALDADGVALKTFLLAPAFKRTPKFMTAIIRGIPRVSFAWIDACLEQMRVLDCVPFLIEPPSGWKPTGPLCKGKRFFLDGSAKFKASWTPVLRLLGGTVSAGLSGASGAGAVIAFVEDAERRAGGVKGCARVVNVDWLIKCIVERTFL